MINVADFEQAAVGLLEAGPLGYFAGGAGDERTLRRNVEAFAEWELVPRVLVDVAEVVRRWSCSVRGSRCRSWWRLWRFQRLAHEDGEEGMARAAGAVGTAMCLSTVATATPLVAAAAPGRGAPFQLYCFRDRA